MKIFWSWQSDTPGKSGRFLVRDALRDAISRLKQTPEIDEPVREALHIDQDIQDVVGSPDLARTILAKIDASDVVVADVTLVGKVASPADAGKKLINSNVAIELGYALRALTDHNVLLVFNQHYGTHEDLPFDLRHKGGSIVFNAPPDASRDLINAERKQLADRFASVLKPYIQRKTDPVVAFAEVPSTFTKATYFERTELLAKVGEAGMDRVTYSYDTGPLCYFRLIPVAALAEPVRLATLKAAAWFAPLLGRGEGVVTNINTHGAIRVAPASYPPSGRAVIDASTQLFESGEIWSISASLVKTKAGIWPIGTPPFAHTVELEQVYYDTLQSMVPFAAKYLALRYPFQVEFGLVGTNGLKLVVKGFDGYFYEKGPILKDEITYRSILKNADADVLDQLLLEFFTRVHDAIGEARPRSYCGFPPNRPGSSRQ